MKFVVTAAQVLCAALVCAGSGRAFSQALVKAEFGTEPTTATQPFTINLKLYNTTSNISGFTFRVWYDSTQMSLLAVTDNTGQPAAGCSYTMGPVVSGSAGGSSDSYRIISLVTSADLVNVVNLGELDFTTTTTWSANVPFMGNFFVTDNGPGDGLFDDTFTDIPHTFNAFQPSAANEWEIYF